MIVVAPFQPADLDALDQGTAPDPLRRDRASRLAMIDHGPSFTARDADGRVLLIAGMAENHPGYATAWALLADRIGREHLALTRATARVIAEASYARVDMIVSTGRRAAHRWALALGFRREGTLAGWAEDGSDVDIYARLKGQG